MSTRRIKKSKGRSGDGHPSDLPRRVQVTRSESIFRALINSCWFGFKWILALAVLAALVGVPYFYLQVGDEIRVRIEEMFASHYPDLEIHVGSARLVRNGIEIHDLSLAERNASGPKAELAHFDEIVVVCATDLPSLVEGTLDVETIIVRRPTIQITRLSDGSWSTAKLLPLPKFGDKPPRLVIENGVAEVFDPRKNPTSTLNFRDMNLEIASPDEVAHDGSGRSVRKVKGTLSGDHLGQVEFTGSITDGGAQWSFEGSINGLKLSPELGQSLPGDPHGPVDLLRSLRAEANVHFVIRNPSSDEQLARFEITGELIRGRIDDARLPYPLNDVRGRVFCDNDRFAVEGLEARNGPTVLALECNGRREGDRFPFRVHATCRGLVLDRRLQDALPERWGSAWPKYLPEGDVDVELTAQYDGNRWSPDVDLRVTCHDVSFSYHQFPYRLVAAQGTIEHKAQKTTIELTAFAGTEEVRLRGEWHGAEDQLVGWIEASGNGLPINRKLLDAMDKRPGNVGAVVRSFQPEGTFNFDFRFWRDAPEESAHHQMNVSLDHCTIRYEAFPYPLFDVHGTIHGRDGNWTFRDFEGRNDTGRVTCQGSLTKIAEGHELAIDLKGREIQLEPQLRDAMRHSLKQLWDELNPRGAVDAKIQVRGLSGNPRPEITIQLWPRPDVTSIEPAFFPYTLNGVRGQIHYANNHVTLRGLRCRHGDVSVWASGTCDFTDDGSWRLQLDRFAANRLRADRELKQALPTRLRNVVQKLDPQGPVNLSGTLELAGGGEPSSFDSGVNRPIQAKWDLEFQFQQTRLTCGIPLENLHGAVRLTGQFDGSRARSHGELNLDSMMYRDLQFTEVRGPIWIDDDVAFLGTQASKLRGEPQPRSITARAYGGTVVADGRIQLGPTPQYALHATLNHGDLARMAQEVFTGRQHLEGQVLAGIQLQGSAEGVHTLTGSGYVRLREADIYRLRQMTSLLKILSVRPPDKTGFTASDIDFHIEGDHVYFDQIKFNGDAISLIGKGQMNLQSDVALAFYAVVGRDRFQIPLVGDLFRGASQQMMLIRVEGKLSDPEIIREPFPGVQQALQRLQAALQRRPERARRWADTQGSPGLGVLPGNRTGLRNRFRKDNESLPHDPRLRAFR